VAWPGADEAAQRRLGDLPYGFNERTWLKELPLQVPLEPRGRPHIISPFVNHSVAIGAYDNHVLLRMHPPRLATAGDGLDVMNLNKPFSALAVSLPEIEAAHHAILAIQ